MQQNKEQEQGGGWESFAREMGCQKKMMS
jgi:hypothetical protein